MNTLFEINWNEQRELYKGIIGLTILYNAETWRIGVADKKRFIVIEIKCLSMCGVNQIESEMRKSVGKKVLQENWHGVCRECLDPLRGERLIGQ